MSESCSEIQLHVLYVLHSTNFNSSREIGLVLRALLYPYKECEIFPREQVNAPY